MKTYIIIIAGCFAALFAQAASVSFSTNNYRVLLNHKLEIPVLLQATQEVYSIAADIVYDSQYLAAIDLDDNITNGVQPTLIFSDAFPNQKKYCAALEDNVQGRLVWGISHNLPTTAGSSFLTNSTLFTASLNAQFIGTNSIMFGFKNLYDFTNGIIKASWDFATVYIITDKLPAPDVNSLSPYSPGNSLAFNWPPVDGAEFYQAFCAHDPYFTNIFQKSDVIADTNYTFTSLIETTQFYYLILATNVIGQQGFSITNSSIQDYYPPTNVVMTVNDGNYYTDSNVIPIKFSAQDVSPMFVATDIDNYISPWANYYYYQTYYYTSSWDNGIKQINGFVKDSAGQTSSVSASIFLDSIAPSNVSILINGGAATTKVTTVNLTLNADDIAPMEMIIANNSDFSDGTWISNASSKTWSIPDKGSGIYTVYARFRDPIGNLSVIALDDIYFDITPGTDTNIVLLAPIDNLNLAPGPITFSWNTGTDVSSPQYLNISPGATVLAVGSQSVTLSDGVYTWFVFATNSWNTITKSQIRSLTVSSSSDPLINPILPQTVREHQVLFVNISVNGTPNLSYIPNEIVGAHYLDTNRFLFSIIPNFGTVGQNWNIPFIAQLAGNIDTQNMTITVEAPAKKIKTKKPLLFEDQDGDLLDIKYSGIKKNNSIVSFDGQRLIISNAYNKGKLVFKVKRNKKDGGDGAFMLHEIYVDDSGKGINVAASVGSLFAENFSISAIKIGGATFSNLYIKSAKIISVKKGSIVGEIVVEDGFKKLIAANILNGKIIVNNGDNISIKTKTNIDKSQIFVNATGNALAVKKIGTGGKGSIIDSIIIVGLSQNDNFTNMPAQAGFKLIKTKTMTNVEIAGSEYKKGKKTKDSKIKVKTPSNSTFYKTKSGIITPEPVK